MKARKIRACSIWRALEVVGDVPVLLLMESAFLGAHRFEEFVERTGLMRPVVSGRLKKLVDAGCLTKVQIGRSKRLAYKLTAKGRGLFPTALMILRWQHRWESANRPHRVQLVHKTCGKYAEPEARCRHCTELIDPRQVAWSEGPGLAEVSAAYSRRRTQVLSANRSGLMVDHAIELFGDRWATLVLRACFTGINRFDDIQRDTLMASNVLSDRLDRLLRQNIIRALPYSEAPLRYEYRLTEKGRDLYPVLLALLEWGDRWFADKRGPPLLLAHSPCARELKLKAACSACGDDLQLDDSSFTLVREKAGARRRRR